MCVAVDVAVVTVDVAVVYGVAGSGVPLSNSQWARRMTFLCACRWLGKADRDRLLVHIHTHTHSQLPTHPHLQSHQLCVSCVLRPACLRQLVSQVPVLAR